MEAQLLDKIEAYLNGWLSPQEEQQFDAEIAQNPDLAKAVDNFGIANDALEVLIEDNLRQEMAQWKMEESSANRVVSINKNKPQARMRSLRTYLAAAASVALLIGFFTFNWVGNNYSNAALSEGMHSSFNMPTVRSGNNVVHPFAEGMEAYKAGQFEKAVPFFQGIGAADARYTEAQYYLGHALLENGNNKEAAAQFKKVVATKDGRYTESAEWYQVLALLSAGDLEAEFINLLTKITNDKNHTFNSKAMQLQSKLNSFWRKLIF